MFKLECDCGRVHQASLEDYIIESGAIQKLPQMLKNYRAVYMVCDPDTYQALGQKAEQILKENRMFSHKLILKKNPLSDYETLGNIVTHLYDLDAEADPSGFSPLPDFILAVGSGTVNDSCRLASYRLGIPYGVAATAPSMDGYASAGTPFLCDGTKRTIKCTTPKYIIADTDILKDAPWDMLLAGIGDMFGKYTGILDWELARDYNGDYYCKQIADQVIDATNLCLNNGYFLEKRDPGCIANVMEGFMVTGLGMAYTGNSRPASGAEHIIAHAWELHDVANHKKPNLHGLEVCQATRIVIEMYRMLYQETDDSHLKELIGKYLPYFDGVEEFCQKMKVPSVVLNREEILDGIYRALPMRDRYTIMFYLRDKGWFERYAETATDRFLESV